MSRIVGPTRPVAVAVFVAVALAGCGFGDDGVDASRSPGASAPVGTPGPTVQASEAPGTPLPVTQSETAWGPIWDALPASFPVPADAQEADAEAGPVSAAYTVATDAAQPRAIADFYQAALEDRGYATGLDGPLEDGSLTVWASNGSCNSQITVLPRGDESYIAVLYSAACRFE